METEEKKKAAPFSATQYSMKFLRKQGYTCEKTEQNVRAPNPAMPGTWKTWKRDLFGFADIVAVKQNTKGVLFVQTTSDQGGGHSGARIEKIAGLVVANVLLRAGNRIHVHGWKKKGPRGGLKSWHVVVTEVTLDSEGFLQTQVLEAVTIGAQKDIDFEKTEDDF